jgi:formylglycine-generating enzyme required for sulfatase activity
VVTNGGAVFPFTMPTPKIQLDDLFDLREELRNAGFDPGLQRAIAGHNLLLALAAQGRLPADPGAWRTWLAPVFCSAPGEQEEFYRRYAGWVRRHAALAAQAKEAPETEATAGELATREIVRSPALRRLPARFRPGRLKAGLRTLLRWLARPRVWAPALAVSVLLAVLSWVWLQRQNSLNIFGRVFSENESQTLEGAEVTYLGQTQITDPQGRFSFDFQLRNRDVLKKWWRNQPDLLKATCEGYFDKEAPVFTSFSLRSPFRFKSSQAQQSEEKKIFLIRRPGEKKVPLVPESELPPSNPTPTPTTTPTPILPHPLNSSLKAWEIALTFAPSLLYVGWLLWTWLRRRALLQSLPNRKQPQLHDLKVEGIERKLFASPRLRRLLLGLRRPRPLPVRELNAPATVRATIRQGGLFTPAYGERRSSPEYLLLIDRASAHDEQANVADELRLRLAENGVFVEPYYFQGDARSCRSAVKDEAAVSLRQLAGRYPDHRLLVFSDGAGFFEPFTGKPQRWLEQFTPWEKRVLLTPEAPAQWGHRERELARREFVLLPASVAGIEELGEWLNYGLAPSPETPAAQPFPESIEERPRRWLERQAPLPDEVEELAAQVNAYLGQDGWDWLCACAVYPQVTWELTLYHGYWLFGGDEQWRETWAERVLRLVRLPWFRYGTMPDWWRERLLGSLQGEKETTVRRGVERLLRSALDHPGEPITLEYAEPDDQSFRARLREMWRRRRLYRGLQTAEPDEPLRDYVFLRFLAGQRPNRLTVSVPEVLRRLLFKDGQRALGFHPATMSVLTSLASMSLLLFFYMYPRVVLPDPSAPSALPIPIPSLPPDALLTPPMSVPAPTSTPAPGPSPAVGPGVPQTAPLTIDPKAQLRVRESQDGYVVELGANLMLDLVALPGGEFMMGSAKSNSEDERPVHRVRVAPFNIGRTEVTQAQWEAVMGSDSSYFKGADRPVESVSWDNAVKFCERLRQLTGVQFRLPTEAEWEYAARAGTTTEYSFGDSESQLGQYAWYGSNSIGQSHPVGKKLANPFGLFDMNGNVWEWCQDVWHNNYQGAPTNGSAWLSGGDSSVRVLRGGSWSGYVDYCRSSNRTDHRPDDLNYNIGFRVVVAARVANSGSQPKKRPGKPDPEELVRAAKTIHIVFKRADIDLATFEKYLLNARGFRELGLVIARSETEADLVVDVSGLNYVIEFTITHRVSNTQIVFGRETGKGSYFKLAIDLVEYLKSVRKSPTIR